jgi:hypothetical protein
MAQALESRMINSFPPAVFRIISWSNHTLNSRSKGSCARLFLRIRKMRIGGLIRWIYALLIFSPLFFFLKTTNGFTLPYVNHFFSGSLSPLLCQHEKTQRDVRVDDFPCVALVPSASCRVSFIVAENVYRVPRVWRRTRGKNDEWSVIRRSHHVRRSRRRALRNSVPPPPPRPSTCCALSTL